MANQYINAMTAIWNSVGTTYYWMKLNVTADASSGINSPRTPINLISKLLHLQAGTIESLRSTSLAMW